MPVSASASANRKTLLHGWDNMELQLRRQGIAEVTHVFIANYHILPSLLPIACVRAIATANYQLIGRIPHKNNMESSRVLLNRKDLSLLGFTREEPILNPTAGGTKIDVGHKRPFFAASALHDGCHKLPVGADRFADSFIGAAWVHVKVDQGENRNHYQQHACKHQPDQDHISRECNIYCRLLS